MEYIGERDMFDVGESYRYFFDEHSILVVGRTKLVILMLLQEDTCYKIGVVMPELEDILIVVVGVLVSRKFIMFFDMEVRLRTIPPHCVGDVLLYELPLLFDEILLGWLVSHQLQIN